MFGVKISLQHTESERLRASHDSLVLTAALKEACSWDVMGKNVS